MKQSFIKTLAKILIPNKKLRTKLKVFVNFIYLYPINKYPSFFKRAFGFYPVRGNLVKTNNKKVLYTVITGDYNPLVSLLEFEKDWDYICFTDNEELIKKENKFWIIISLKNQDMDKAKLSRLPKILAHKFLSEYKYSLYIDGNIDIISKTLFEKANNLINHNTKLALTKHYERDCLYEEFKVCKVLKKDLAENMEKQIQIFKEQGFPINYELKENNIILRQHNDEKIINLMEQWWYWVENYSKRDQLSLMYVLWKNNYNNVPDIMDKPVRLCHNDLIFRGHNK